MSRVSSLNSSASFLRPSAPRSVMSFSSGSDISLMFTSRTSVSGMPSILSGTSAERARDGRWALALSRHARLSHGAAWPADSAQAS